MVAKRRDEAARALIQRCASVYSSFDDFSHDLQSYQVVQTYATRDAQLKYVHMYFAKYVGLWRAVRSRLPQNDHPVWSVGAGPLLDLLGWFWEQPSEQETYAIDVLDWAAARGLDEWKTLTGLLVPTLEYKPPHYFPDTIQPPQCVGIDAEPLFPTSIHERAEVHFPFVLNHLLGKKSALLANKRHLLVDWVQDLRTRGCRLVIADMQFEDRTRGFWNTVCEQFSVAEEPYTLDFHRPWLSELGPIYHDDGQSWRRCSTHMSTATVLVLHDDAAFFLRD